MMEKITLRPLTLDDLDITAKLVQNPDVALFLYTCKLNDWGDHNI